MNTLWKKKWLNYIFSIILPFIALLVQWLLWDYFKPYVWFLFFPTVFFSAWLSGLKGGITATLISAFLVLYFFITPQFSFTVENRHNFYSIAVFMFTGFLFSIIQERLKKANVKISNSLTEMKNANLRIQHLYEKTKELEQIKSNFFANVSHELRTPLTLILAPLGDILEKSELRANDKQSLEIIDRNAKLLYLHVNELLDLSKLDAGKMTLQYCDIDISHLMKVLVAQFESLATQRSIELILKSPESLFLQADVKKFQRIIINLLSNAFKHTPQNGKIVISTSLVENYLEVTVEDSGPGIPENMRMNVFERFLSIENTLNQNNVGSGLGLSIVKEFVELHGGQVVADQSSYGGALLKVTIPYIKPGKYKTETPSTEIDYLHINTELNLLSAGTTVSQETKIRTDFKDKPTILVVEDNVDMNNYISKSLSERYNVKSVFNGKDGLEAAIELLPNIIITDIMMPVMDGEEMIKKIRDHKKLIDIPIILLTAKITENFQIFANKHKVEEFIAKPFTMKLLKSKVHNLIDQQNRQKERLAESERRYNILIEQAADAYFVFDENAKIIEVNSTTCKTLGYSKEELLTLYLPDIEIDYVPDKIFETFKALEKVKHVNGVGHHKKKDGTIFPVEISLSFSEIDGSKFYMAIVRDISEKEKNAFKLKESEFRYRSLFERMLNGFAYCKMIFDEGKPVDFRYISVNEAFKTLTGLYNAEGKLVSELIPGIRESDPEIFEIYNRTATKGEPEYFEHYVKALNNWFSVSVYSPEKEYFVAVFDVITERKKMEQSLRESEERYRTIVQDQIELICRYNKNGKILFANEVFYNFFGLKQKHLIRTNWQPKFHEDDKPIVTSKVKSLTSLNPSAMVEVRLYSGTGELRWMQIIFHVLFDSGGKFKEIQAVGLDISDRKKIEEKLREKQNLLDRMSKMAKVGGWGFDARTMYGSWTEETARIYDLDPSEYASALEGISFFQGENKEKIKRAIQEAIDFARPYDLELELTSAKGIKKRIRTIGQPIIKKGKVVRIEGAIQDITEAKIAEAELKQSEERFSKAFSSSPVGMILSKLNSGEMIETNEAYCAMIGYTREEVVGKTSFELNLWIDENDRNMLMEKVKRDEPIRNIEIRTRTKKGEIRLIKYSIEIIELKNEKCIVSFAEDVTEQKNMQIELLESEEKFRNLFETTSDSIIIVNQETSDIVDVNIAATHLYGYSQQEFKQMKDYLLYDDPESMKITSKSSNTEVSLNYHRKKNGNIFPVEITGGYFKQGNITYHTAFIRDITERINAERAVQKMNSELRKKNEEYMALNEEYMSLNEELVNSYNEISISEERFEKAFRSNPAGVIITRVSDGIILDVNASYYKLLGYDPNSLIGRSGKELSIYKNDADREEIINQLNKSGTVHNYETSLCTKKGDIVYVLLSIETISLNREKCLLTTMHNITGLKMAEKEIIVAKEKAEESDRLKSAFLANMSHEIRTPMNAIIGFSDFLNKPGITDEKRKRFTGLIQQRAYDLLNIIEDILDISKIEVGQMKIFPTEIKLHELMLELYEYYKLKIKKTENKPELKISLSIPRELKKLIFQSDKQRLKQILNNLLDNAIKFTHQGEIEFGCLPKSEDGIVFFVKDTGIGIPIEKQGIIFDRFRQAEESYTVRQYGGTGLGLSIVKGIINLIGGKIWLESDPGKGTIFYFNIPFSDETYIEEEVTNENGLKHLAWIDKTALLVEDDAANTYYLKELFEGTGLNLLFAATGEGAMNIFNENKKIDIVLMDIRLPGINGLDLTRLMKKINPDIVIIAQTAYAGSADIKDCIDAGCNDYISKPIYIDKLMEMMGKYLNKPGKK